MSEKISLDNELDTLKDKIIEELKQGKDVVLKNTSKGLKIQSMKVNVIK